MILKKKTYYSGNEDSPEGKVLAKPGAIFISESNGSVWLKNGGETVDDWSQIGSIAAPTSVTIPGVLKIDSEGLKLWNTTQNSWIHVTAIGSAGAQSLDLAPST